MHVSAEKKITVGFGVALLMLSLLSAASYWSTTSLVKTTGWVTHTREVLDELDEVPLQLARAETAQRTYLLTGDEQFLVSYQAAEAATQHEIADARKLITEIPAQQQRLNTLAFHVQEGFAALQWTMHIRQGQGLKAAAQDVLGEKSRKVVDDVEGLTQAIETAERDLLQRQLVKADRSATHTIAVILASSLVVVCIVIVAGLLVRHDLTKRKCAEEALQKSEERYRSLFETAREGIATFTGDGTITSVNQGLEAMIQWPREELLGRHYREISTPDSAARWEERLRRALAVERLPSLYEAELVRKDGRVVPVEVQASFLRNKDGNPVEILALFRDVTMKVDIGLSSSMRW
jgi:PAS domain S-box-containing protein